MSNHMKDWEFMNAQGMERHGIEWEKKGTNEEHLLVLEFKKKEHAKEVAELDKLLEEKRENIQVLDAMRKDNLEQLDGLAEKIKEAESKADEAIVESEEATKKAQRAEKKLQEVAPLVDRVWAYAGEYGRPADGLLPEARKLETGKSYREKKAIPFFEKLMKKLLSLYVAYGQMKDKYEKLIRDYNNVLNQKERWQGYSKTLEQKVEELEEVVKDYGRVRNVLGAGAADKLLKNVKEKERMTVEAEKEKRKLQRKYSRDER